MQAKDYMIGKLFQQPFRLVVPLYQRPYVWNEEDQWNPLWQDIRVLAECYLDGDDDIKPHFLGAVVVDNDPRPIGYLNCHTIVDGQQRLTTIQLFLEAFADILQWLWDSGETEKAEIKDQVRSMTRNKEVLADDDDAEFKIWPMNTDRLAYKEVMSATSPEKLHEIKDEAGVIENRLYEAYEFFYTSINKWLEAQEYSKPTIMALFEIIHNYLQLVVIDLENAVDPQLIFETLNARGTPLNASDLIKNLLFHKAALALLDGPDLYNKYWTHFDNDYPYWSKSIGKGAMRKPRIDNFMHHYLTMKVRDEVQVNRLYVEYRTYDDVTKPDIAAQLSEIQRFAAIYKSFDDKGTGEAARIISRLKQLDTTPVMPIVLALMADQSLSNAQRLQVLRDLESFLVRRIVCRLTWKAYNRVFIDLVRTIEDGRVSPSRIRDKMLSWNEETNKWPDDKAFRSAWQNYEAYYWIAQAKVRTILEALETVVKSDKAENISIDEVLTIEHLLPQTWQRHYPLPGKRDSDEETEERERLIHTFGNLTLLTKKLNPSVSNGPWVQLTEAGEKGKRHEILRHSNLGLNSMLVDNETWDEEAIKARGEFLFNKAKRLWPYPG